MRGNHDVYQSYYPCGVHIKGDEIQAIDVTNNHVHASEPIAGPVGSKERDNQWERLSQLAHAVNHYLRSIPINAKYEHIPLDQAVKAAQENLVAPAILHNDYPR